jgi:SAM-dependent methyltransferase
MARSRFAGGDQGYLRDEQYRDASRLSVRTNLHLRYGTAAVPWFEWVRALVDLQASQHVLEVGCGSGALWDLGAAKVPDGLELTLCDLSPGMVAEAVARAAATGRFARVEGREADAQALPFDAAAFDRVVANHMLYHLPDPASGVAELARVVGADGLVVVATNGERHMRELRELKAAIFGVPLVDPTVDVFGIDVGFATLRDHFADVRWVRYEDELRCTDPADVLAYACSTPPGEDATPAQRAALARAIDVAVDAGGGVMRITKDVGCFVCRAPQRL